MGCLYKRVFSTGNVKPRAYFLRDFVYHKFHYPSGVDQIYMNLKAQFNPLYIHNDRFFLVQSDVSEYMYVYRYIYIYVCMYVHICICLCVLPDSSLCEIPQDAAELLRVEQCHNKMFAFAIQTFIQSTRWSHIHT